MTIRTQAVPITLDAGDFQITHAGVTMGLKLSHMPSPMGMLPSLYVVEKVGSEWRAPAENEMALDFLGEIENLGVARWINDRLLPKLNAWMRKRFTGVDPEPVNVPQILLDLDGALARLTVTTGADGVPRVSA